MEAATKKRVIIGSVIAAVVLIIGGVLFYMWWRKRHPATSSSGGRTDSGGGDAGGTAAPSLEDLEKKAKEALGEGWDLSIEAKKKKAEAAADPFAPTTTPTPGQYYQAHDGDSDTLIVKHAGFPAAQRHAAAIAMRDHPANEWIGTTVLDESWGRQLRLFRRFSPNVGKEALPFAHNTTWMPKTSSSTKWPSVYVPTLAEVTA